MHRNVTLLVFGLIIASIELADGATPDPKMRKKLLENYDPMAQPYPTGTSISTTTVTMNTLNVIHYNIDDKEQTLEIHAWLYMGWHDERLRWSQYFRDHRGYLHFKKSEIWRPDITLYNTAKPKIMDEFADEAHILVKSNGSTIWVPPIRFITNCKMNLLLWPFDTQECNVKLGSWTFHEQEVDLQLGAGGPDTWIRIMSYEGHSFANNTEWLITEASAKRTSKKYACCEEDYVDITYNFKLARKYASYAYTVIFPVIMISVVSVLNFLLPTNSVSRITLGCFNFLTIVAYLLYFRMRLPTIDHVPSIVKLFVWDLFITTVNLVLTISLMVYTNWSNGRGMSNNTPQWAKSILNSGIGAFLCLGQTADSDKKGSNQAQIDNNCREDGPSPPKIGKEGNMTANLIDRFAFVLFAFLTIIMLFYHLC